MSDNQTLQKINEIFSVTGTPKISEEEYEIFYDEILKFQPEEPRLALLIRLVQCRENIDLYLYILDTIISNNNFGWPKKLFLFNQIYTLLFTTTLANNPKILEKEYQLYAQLSDNFFSLFPNYLPASHGKDNLVIVTTQQFLNLSHGPTKTTLDRAYILAKYLGKSIVIINTAELNGGEEIPLFNYNAPLINNSFNDIKRISYQDCSFEFLQFDPNTPSYESACLLLEMIKDLKPQFIVNIGVSSLMVDLCNRLVPVLNINTVPSLLAFMPHSWQAVGSNFILDSNVQKYLDIINQPYDSIIKSDFTWSLVEQTKTVTRQELGLPQSAFVVALIGGRLDREISEEFLDMLDEVASDRIHFIIIGGMDKYLALKESHSNFVSHSTNLGFVEDVLSVLDNCDLYLNPPRQGGGTSVVEAMYKGLPAVTLPWGDVTLSCGPDFFCHDLEDMKNTIIRYSTDSEFYKKQSAKAKGQADIALDSKTAFIKILQDFAKKAGIPL